MLREKTISKGGRENRLGLWGWLGGGRYGIDRILYTFQRLSGLLILLYLLLHIIVTGTRVRGEMAWESLMGRMEGPLFRFLEFLLVAVISYHAFNGLRLILVEWFGLGIGKPVRPVYPYVTSIKRQRPLLLGVMFLAFIFIVISALGFLIQP
jgi:succinate dehydrogenase / fumarate reductase cytochrome b subunit